MTVTVQASKQRIVDAISLGVLTTEEAATKLEALREQEQRLTVELSSIAEKTAIMAEWQETITSLREQNITEILYSLTENKPIAFRRLLSLIFEPNSLKVETTGKGRNWTGKLVGYKLNSIIQREVESFERQSFGRIPG